MSKNVIISNPKTFEELKKAFKLGGAEKLHVLSDFDRTLTTAFVNGKKIPAFITILRDEGYLSEEYRKQAHALADYYRPFEDDLTYPLDKKKEKMHEWWSKHFELLIKSGLSKKDITKAIESGRIQLRKGISELLKSLNNKKVPLVIISSSGLGNSIPMYLKKQGELYGNIHIITNLYEWGEDGKAIGVKEPFIHCMNKDETTIQDHPEAYLAIKERKNVILLGDSLGDLGMITGFDYENLIKIGFLNDKVEENLEEYKKSFDIVITNDSSMDYVNELIKEITN